MNFEPDAPGLAGVAIVVLVGLPLLLIWIGLKACGVL